MADKPFENPYAKYTSFKNITLDVIMPALSANGWKVLCCVIRQTWGWVDPTSPTGRKQSDQLSYSQLMTKTGIKSKATISRAIKENLAAGYLLRGQVGADARSDLPLYAYALNTEYEISGSKTVPLSSSENEPHSSSKTVPTKNKEKPTNGDGVVHLLESIGIESAIAEQLADKPAADIRGWVAYVQQGEGLTNPAGLVVARLKAGIPPPQLKASTAWINCRCGHQRPPTDQCEVCGKCFDCCDCDD